MLTHNHIYGRLTVQLGTHETHAIANTISPRGSKISIYEELQVSSGAGLWDTPTSKTNLPRPNLKILFLEAD